MRGLLGALAAAILFGAVAPSAFAASNASSDFKVEKIPRSALGLGAVGGAGPVEVVAEQVLVQFSTAATGTQVDNALSALGGVSSMTMTTPGWVLVTLPAGASVVPYLSRLNGFPGVAQVVPNHVVHMHAYPSDPGVANQYSLTNTDAFAGWDIETGNSHTVTVAVIDSGIDFSNQPDLIPKYVNDNTVNVYCNPSGAACVADNPPAPACSHATHVASVAAAATNNGIGVAGVSWGAKLASIRVFSPGCAGTSDASLANAVNYVYSTLKAKAALGQLVANMSIGSTNQGATCAGDLPLTKAQLTNLVANNIPIAISAGNSSPPSENCSISGTNGVTAPASCAGISAGAGIIPVGATNASNGVAYFSCGGSELAAHGVSAPGDSVLVDEMGGGTTNDSGTSFSSPYVAGLMALMLSAKPGLTPAQVEAALRGGANSLGGQSLAPQSGNGSGAGQVNVFRTMRLTVNGTLADFEGDKKAIAFPNPFRISQQRTVSFTIPTSLQSSSPTIRVYAMDGTLVRSLSGLVWDGKNDAGNLVAAGTYVFFVKTDAGTTKGRVAVIR